MGAEELGVKELGVRELGVRDAGPGGVSNEGLPAPEPEPSPLGSGRVGPSLAGKTNDASFKGLVSNDF